MMRVFLDANVLFSAAWREESGTGKLWEKQDVQLVTSPYALMEAQRNLHLKKPAAVERLSKLVNKVEVSPSTATLSDDYGLPEKDRPLSGPRCFQRQARRYEITFSGEAGGN